MDLVVTLVDTDQPYLITILMRVMMTVRVHFQYMDVQIQMLNNYNPSTNDDGTCCYGDVLEIIVTTDNYPTETSWR